MVAGFIRDSQSPGCALGDFLTAKMKAILGKKLKMDQLWKDNKVIPVTVIQALPNQAALVRTAEKDGYSAVQLKLGRASREFRPKAGDVLGDVASGSEISVDVFSEGDLVRVSGLSKGRGFQGVVKRHGFAGGPKTHGQKNRLRAPGSIGSTAFQRVVPGRRMAGHMGNERVTLKNLEVAGVDKENNLLFIRGAVPGPRGGLIEIVKFETVKKK